MLPLAAMTVENVNMPRDMMDVNERSISPVMTISVTVSATMPKKGVVDMNA